MPSPPALSFTLLGTLSSLSKQKSRVVSTIYQNVSSDIEQEQMFYSCSEDELERNDPLQQLSGVSGKDANNQSGWIAAARQARNSFETASSTSSNPRPKSQRSSKSVSAFQTEQKDLGGKEPSKSKSVLQFPYMAKSEPKRMGNPSRISHSSLRHFETVSRNKSHPFRSSNLSKRASLSSPLCSEVRVSSSAFSLREALNQARSTSSLAQSPHLSISSLTKNKRSRLSKKQPQMIPNYKSMPTNSLSERVSPCPSSRLIKPSKSVDPNFLSSPSFPLNAPLGETNTNNPIPTTSGLHLSSPQFSHSDNTMEFNSDAQNCEEQENQKPSRVRKALISRSNRKLAQIPTSANNVRTSKSHMQSKAPENRLRPSGKILEHGGKNIEMSSIESNSKKGRLKARCQSNRLLACQSGNNRSGSSTKCNNSTSGGTHENDGWSETEVRDLILWSRKISARSVNYWTLVANHLPNRTDLECAQKLMKIEELKVKPRNLPSNAPILTSASSTSQFAVSCSKRKSVEDLMAKIPKTGNTKKWRMNHLIQKLSSNTLQRKDILLEALEDKRNTVGVIAKESVKEGAYCGESGEDGFGSHNGGPGEDKGRVCGNERFISSVNNKKDNCTDNTVDNSVDVCPMEIDTVVLISSPNSDRGDGKGVSCYQGSVKDGEGRGGGDATLASWSMTPGQRRALSNLHTGLTPRTGHLGDEQREEGKMVLCEKGRKGGKEKGLIKTASLQHTVCGPSKNVAFRSHNHHLTHLSKYTSDLASTIGTTRTLEMERLLEKHRNRFVTNLPSTQRRKANRNGREGEEEKEDWCLAEKQRVATAKGKVVTQKKYSQCSAASLQRNRFFRSVVSPLNPNCGNDDFFVTRDEVNQMLTKKEKQIKKSRLKESVESLKWIQENGSTEFEREDASRDLIILGVKEGSTDDDNEDSESNDDCNSHDSESQTDEE